VIFVPTEHGSDNISISGTISSVLKNSTIKMELSFKDKRNVFISDEMLYGYLSANG
jgi:hypothetical protein